MHDPLDVYRGKYKEFIEGIKESRPLNERFDYCEDHHILPRCTFEDKSDPRIDDEDNHINLTYREHFIAHQILWKENPEAEKLFYAYWRMCNRKITQATPEEYEEARRQLSDSNPGRRHTIEAREKMSSSHRGVPLSEIHRNSISKSLKGYNKSESHRKNLSESLRGRVYSQETRENMSKSHLGKVHTEETKRKISIATSGDSNPFYSHRHSEESKKKMSIAKSGKNHPMYGKHYSSRSYDVVCIICGEHFIGTSPTSKRCMKCKSTE